MLRRSLVTALTAAGLLAAALATAPAHAQGAAKTLRFVPHANLTVLYPTWTTAYVTRNHAYMIYDTLFAVNQKGEIKPQMVDKYTTSKDSKVPGPSPCATGSSFTTASRLPAKT